MSEALFWARHIKVDDVIDSDRLGGFLDLVYGRNEWEHEVFPSGVIEIRTKKEEPKDLAKALRDIGCLKTDTKTDKPE